MACYVQTPFQAATTQEIIDRVKLGAWEFQPATSWRDVSPAAKEMVSGGWVGREGGRGEEEGGGGGCVEAGLMVNAHKRTRLLVTLRPPSPTLVRMPRAGGQHDAT